MFNKAFIVIVILESQLVDSKIVESKQLWACVMTLNIQLLNFTCKIRVWKMSSRSGILLVLDVSVQTAVQMVKLPSQHVIKFSRSLLMNYHLIQVCWIRGRIKTWPLRADTTALECETQLKPSTTVLLIFNCVTTMKWYFKNF